MIRALRTLRRSALLALAFSMPGLAKCPISDGTTLVVRAAVGDLYVDTTGREPVAEIQVENNAVQIQETCGKGGVEFTSNGPDYIRGTVGFRIVTSNAVNLDLATMAGRMNVAEVE